MADEYAEWKAEQARKYLRRVRRAGIECARLEAKIADEYAKAEGVSGIDYSSDKVAGSANPDAIPNAVARITDLIREYAADLAGYEDERHQAYDTLMQMPKRNERDALAFHYVLGYDWPKVRERMGYTKDGMDSLVKRALANYWDYMPRMERDILPPAV